MNQKQWRLQIAIFTAYALGGVLFSQAASFARWDDFHSPSHFINFHAMLLLVAGLAFTALAGGVSFLGARMSLIERRLDEAIRTRNA
jgi:hypothetical protein